MGLANDRALFQLRRFKFNVQLKESGYLNLAPLKTIMRIFKWFVKTQNIKDGDLKIELLSFPDFVLTSKPREIRMGKGKGQEKKKVAFVQKGSILLSIKSRKVQMYLLKKFVLRITKLLPFKHQLVYSP